MTLCDLMGDLKGTRCGVPHLLAPYQLNQPVPHNF